MFGSRSSLCPIPTVRGSESYTQCSAATTVIPDYPHPWAEAAPLHPTGDGNWWTGTLSPNAGHADGTGGIVDNLAFQAGQLAAAEWSNHRRPYATPSLQQDVHLSGVATVRVRVASDATAANLTVWLVSLPWTDSDDKVEALRRALLPVS